LVKIDAKAVGHGRQVTFQMAEVAAPWQLFRKILSPRPRPASMTAGEVDSQAKTTEGWVWMTKNMANGLPSAGRFPNTRYRMAANWDAVPWAAGIL
jgi:hypothetical protein